MRLHPHPPTGPDPLSQAHGLDQAPILAAAPSVAPPGRRVYGSPGASAMAEYRARRAAELANWRATLPWRAAAVIGAAVVGHMLASIAGLQETWPAMLTAAAACAWRLRFRASQPTRAWRHGARGERATARQLRKLTRRDPTVTVFHDLQVPGSRANIDHLVISPAGVFAIDSKRWRGHVRRGPDGTLWHGHHPLSPTLDTVRWEAEQAATALEAPVLPVVAIHRARVVWGPHLDAGVAITAASGVNRLLRGDPRLTAQQLIRLAEIASARLYPAG